MSIKRRSESYSPLKCKHIANVTLIVLLIMFELSIITLNSCEEYFNLAHNRTYCVCFFCYFTLQKPLHTKVPAKIRNSKNA